MDIKNIRIFKNPSIKTRLCALSVAGIIAITSLAGCSSEPTSTGNAHRVHYEEPARNDFKKTFGKGEHVISVPIKKDPSQSRIQYDYHEGYRVTGLSLSDLKNDGNDFESGCVTYINIVPVECVASGRDDNRLLAYTDFGTPIEMQNSYNGNVTSDTKDFGVGEHIISIPMNINPSNQNIQYDYYEGYEIVTVATTDLKNSGTDFEGGCIMYSNIIPVRCNVSYYDEENKGFYMELGNPIEKEMAKTLK